MSELLDPTSSSQASPHSSNLGINFLASQNRQGETSNSSNYNPGKLYNKGVADANGTDHSIGTNETLLSEPAAMYKQGQKSRSRSTLIRVYSENERSNFHDSTGARIYDDLRYRPVHHDGQNGSPTKTSPIDIYSKSKRRHSSSAEEERELYRRNLKVSQHSYGDMQDEYIPDLDFSNTVSQWQSDENVLENRGGSGQRQEQSESPCYNNWADYEADVSRSSSMSSSSIVFKSAHAKVGPIPLPQTSIPMASPTRLRHQDTSTTFDERTPRGSSLSFARNRASPNINAQPGRLYKRQRSGLDFESPSSPWTATSVIATSFASSNDGRFSAEELTDIIKYLPEDFTSLPYSQRKKILLEQFPNVDYKSMMASIKRAQLTSAKSSTQLQSNRSRRGSLASQYLSSFTPSSSSYKPDDKGSTIMGYTLGKIIGFGAWGMIRECYKSTAGQSEKSESSTSAVKAIKIVRFKNNGIVKNQVLKEVRMWSKLKHKNILPLLKWQIDESYALYCLTDKIDGGTLYDLVASWGNAKNSTIDLALRSKFTAELGLQVVQGLRYMHSKQIVHGDVKLENCLLTSRQSNDGWTVILCDFGMSSEFHQRETQAENVGGSKEFGGDKRKDPSDGSRPFARSLSNSVLKDTLRRQHRTINHGHGPMGVSSFPKQYGPALSSTNLTGNFVSPNELTRASSMESISNSTSMGTDSTPVSPAKDENSHNYIGSLPYAAPELLEPTPPSLSPSADVWALGVTLYTMLMGKLLFKHDYEPRLRAMIAAAKYDVRPLEKVCNANIDKSPSHSLFDAVKGCLVKNVSKRWTLDCIESSLADYVSSLSKATFEISKNSNHDNSMHLKTAEATQKVIDSKTII
ncbi:LAFA_0G04368g1_1 [Lachancea sp. 'fantastica']|nr:LAFA_0G04368g1_1 [Lachancea sp. 'fantastica']